MYPLDFSVKYLSSVVPGHVIERSTAGLGQLSLHVFVLQYNYFHIVNSDSKKMELILPMLSHSLYVV